MSSCRFRVDVTTQVRNLALTNRCHGCALFVIDHEVGGYAHQDMHMYGSWNACTCRASVWVMLFSAQSRLSAPPILNAHYSVDTQPTVNTSSIQVLRPYSVHRRYSLLNRSSVLGRCTVLRRYSAVSTRPRLSRPAVLRRCCVPHRCSGLT